MNPTPRSPKIAIDARYVRERPSGIGAMVEALIHHVPALMPEASFLLLRHPLAPDRLSSAQNVTEVTLPAEANGPGTLLALPRLVDLAGVDLFHAPSNILPAGLTMRTVVTVHDTMWLTNPVLCGTSGLWGQVQTWFYRNGIRRALHRADRIITISNATRGDVLAEAPMARHRCTTIEHGIDERFRPAINASDHEKAAAVRQRYAPGAKRHVMIVGRSAPYKNQERAIAAFLRAFERQEDTHLIVVQRLGHGALTHIPGGRLHVIPPIPEQDLIDLYRGALCLCHPSLQEGWGMPIGEAMACGCPVVTSHRSAMPEVAGDAAVYVDPLDIGSIADGLRRLAGSARLRAEKVEAGLSRVERLTWRRHAERTVSVYREVLEAGCAREAA